ncbi:MAG: peptidyl-prolyl cis-trans isomerase SurA [Chloroflexota bacterium]|nr:peptidyl-prolyl cis-trans isomerase SurA [Chloroflexota bacterium]
MTFRAKPVVKREHRPAWEAQDRRNFYLNLGFGLIVVLALLILAIYVGLSWYGAHLAAVASVDGQSITKDEFRDRYAIEQWRLDETEARISTDVLAGHLTEAQGTAEKSAITTARGTLAKDTLERLIDAKLQAKLAAQEGVTITPADIDARLVVEATTSEIRHSWLIAVAPVIDPGAIEPTTAQKAEARTKAEAALKDIQGGKSWEEVAKTVSTDAATAAQGGELGWIGATNTQADEPFLKALFAVPVNTPTAVVEGTDGTFRIGRATEIVASSVDSAYQAKFQNKGISLDHYRTVVAGDVTHEKLQAKIVADVTGPGPQRRVSEIYLKEPATPPGTDAIKVRHILYSPNGDPSTASTVAPNDPAWARAQSLATAAYARLKTNPALFDSIARKESNESSALGATGSGGKLPYFDSSSTVDAAFKAAILAANLKPGDILPPVKSAFGWHVIQVMYRPTDVDHLKALKTQSDQGADFGILARDNSESTTASIGGDIGWIVKGQLGDELSNAIFAAPVGKTTDVITVAGDGSYLLKVFEEQTRTPEGRQLTELTSTAFSKWYGAKKTAAVITRDSAITSSTN